MVQGCRAARPALPGRDKGWQCDGEGLVAVQIDGDPIVAMGVPVVVLESLIDKARVADKIDYQPLPFVGGDHLHLMVREA
jgi:hypothetical protein